MEYHDVLALCCNNLAALKGQQQSSVDAIAWHERAIALQERLVRMSPAVVRHRSDLAASLNNLGVAHCRANRAADADAAFDRARTLFATLADDYPDETAYQSSLAALLNNQALALAESGRHEDALRIYSTAIESQRACWQRRQDSPLMREVLSKMYYNYGQSLRSAGMLQEAGDAALARRELWRGNGDRLFRVAVELAELGADSRHQYGKANVQTTTWADEVVATLRLAIDAGWPADIDLRSDERFAHLRSDEKFAALIAERTAALETKATPENRAGVTSRKKK
jgi:tetratricopeptide (TPR) repeat protein